MLRLHFAVQPLQFAFFEVYSKFLSSSGEIKVDFSIFCSFAYKAQPNAPISPEIAGRTTVLPISSSNALKTDSL